MFKVTGNDGSVYGLVDTYEDAIGIVETKKLGRDGKKISNPQNATRASSMTFKIEEVPESTHPGRGERILPFNRRYI